MTLTRENTSTGVREDVINAFLSNGGHNYEAVRIFLLKLNHRELIKFAKEQLRITDDMGEVGLLIARLEESGYSRFDLDSLADVLVPLAIELIY